MGERISWLMVATNAPFAFEAASASAFARSSSLRVRGEMLLPLQ